MLRQILLSIEQAQQAHQESPIKTDTVLRTYLLTAVTTSTPHIIKFDLPVFQLNGVLRADLSAVATVCAGISLLNGLGDKEAFGKPVKRLR
jgi:hypothetical protein